MGCLYQIILLPFQIMYFMWNFMIATIKSMFTLIISFYTWGIKSIFNIKPTKTTKKINNKESSFDKEAKLWGLTEEDKRIAKEERLSPADYIEAEERDNDELIDDD